MALAFHAAVSSSVLSQPVLLPLAGEVDRFAFVAYKVYRFDVFLSLEYYLLRHIDHAGLANVVRRSGAFVRFVWREDKHPLGKLMKAVLRPLVPLALIGLGVVVGGGVAGRQDAARGGQPAGPWPRLQPPGRRARLARLQDQWLTNRHAAAHKDSR